jgi:hypothetical protein
LEKKDLQNWNLEGSTASKFALIYILRFPPNSC